MKSLYKHYPCLCNKMPLISVVIPAYNVGDYLDRCLNSIINQSTNNYEVIIVDDCGLDDSLAIAKKWALKYEEISLIENERNLGTFHARRIGAGRSKGDYVIFVDPDDSLETNACLLIEEAVIRNSPDIIFYAFSNRRGNKAYKSCRVNVQSEIFDPAEFVIKNKKINLGTPGKVYKRELLLAAYESLSVQENFRYTFSEDKTLLAGILLGALKASYIPTSIYNYYINEGKSITTLNNEKNIKSKLLQLDSSKKILMMLKSNCQSVDHIGRSSSIINYILKDLEYDELFISRMTNEINLGVGYAASMYRCYKIRRDIRDLVRLLLNVGTFGLLKV